MRRWLKGLAVGAAIGLAGALFAVTPLAVDLEQEVGLAWLFKVRGAIAPPPEIVVVAINEQSAGKMALPARPRDWSRTVHGRLLDTMSRRGASVVVFDLAFDRPKAPDDDAAFARAVAASRRAVLIERLDGKRQPLLGADGRPKGWVWVERLIPPVPELAAAARALGPFPLPKTQEAVFRFWAFKPSAGDVATLPAVALQLHALTDYGEWRDALRRGGLPDAEKLPATADEMAGAESVRHLMRSLRAAFRSDPDLAMRITALAGKGRDGGRRAPPIAALSRLYAGEDHLYLNFYGPPGTIPTVPYHVMLSDDPPEAYRWTRDLQGKVVFVGFSDLYDPGQPDRFYSVFTRDDGVDLSGVEIMATAFGNLLTDRALRPTGVWATAAIVFAVGLFLGLCTYVLPAMLAVPLALAATAAFGAGAQFAFDNGGLWLPLATPALLQFPLALVAGLLGQYLLERSQKRQFSDAIRYYLPDNVVRELTEHGLDPNAANSVVYGTCLATDMSGFTTISERMTPRDLAVFMNDYFDTLATPLKRHDVDVTEFHADTIMCAWTAPERAVAARRKAVQAALDVIGAVHEFNAQRPDVSLYPRIGLEDGSIYVGHAGGGGRMSYSILGDCANTAARLESLNKQIGTHVLASDSVVDELDELPLRPLGRFKLVGKTEPVEVVEILMNGAVAANGHGDLCGRFAEAHRAFAEGKWRLAAELFDAILHDFPDDGPSRFYADLSRAHAAAPPGGDDPSVIVLDSK